MKNSLDYAAMGGMKSNLRGGVKSAKSVKSAASTSRDTVSDARLTSISKKHRDNLLIAYGLPHEEWSRQAEYYPLKERKERKADAELAAYIKAMSLAGYKRKTSKKSHKRHSSRKKHRKRRTRRH